MEKNIEQIAGGLQCDNPACDWKDHTIEHDKFEEWIDKSCPKCGENVLTKEDYENSLKLHAMIDFINSMTPDELNEFAALAGKADLNDPIIEKLKALDLSDSESVTVTVDCHKTIKITDIIPNNENKPNP